MPVALMLLLALSVHGRVVLDDGPAPGVTVSIISPERTVRTTTDVGGQYWFQSIQPGRYEIEFALDGFMTERLLIVVRKDGNELPNQALKVAREITLECASPCWSSSPKTEWDKPACYEYDLDTDSSRERNAATRRRWAC